VTEPAALARVSGWPSIGERGSGEPPRLAPPAWLRAGVVAAWTALPNVSGAPPGDEHGVP